MNEKIIDGNKLIAVFMEYKFDGIEFIIPEHAIIIPFDCQPKKSTSLHCFTTTIYKPKNLKFHSSWDWLVPVVEKILGTENNSSDWEKHYTQIHDSLWSINIESVWLSVVEFIKWYNKQK